MSSPSFRLRPALMAGIASTILMTAIPVILPPTPAAAQQVNVSVQFRTALEPYGKWQRHKRWGNVWVPARVSGDWRPYTRGRWVYSDDYGWYWVSADEEANWGWVVYHYGRWVDDDEFGWVWIPGNEWGPAWVDWRRGDDYVGWAPLPPEEIVVEYRDEPDYWTFVRPRDLIAPRIYAAILPARQRDVYFRNTVVVNSTVVVRDRRFAVNPGIPPAYIAAAYGRPIKTFNVRPRVLAGTARIDGAIEVRSDELRRDRGRRGRGEREITQLQETKTVIRPARTVPKAQALGKNEPGRLGDNPPKAARGETTGAAPSATRAPAPDNAAKNAKDIGNSAAPDKSRAAIRKGQGSATEGRGSQTTAPANDKPAAATGLKKGDRERRDLGARTDDKRAQPSRHGATQSTPGINDHARTARPDRTVAPQPRQASPRGPGRDERSVDRAQRMAPSARQSGPGPRIERPAQASRPVMPPTAARPSAPPPTARAPSATPAPAARAPGPAPAPAARAPSPAPAPAARAPSPAPAPAAQAPRPQPSTTGAGAPSRPQHPGGGPGNPH